MIDPYENLSNIKKTAKESSLEAYDILENGWAKRTYPRIDIKKTIPWNLESHDKRTWNFYIHSWNMIDTLLFAYNLNTDEALFAPALKIALDWIERYVDLEKNLPLVIENSIDFSWYDMAVGLRAYRLAYIFDKYRSDIQAYDATAKKLWSALLAHQAYLSDDSNITFHNNHGYYQATGQIAMGRRFSQYSDVMANALDQGIERFKVMLDQQFTIDGVHREHSPDYHRMVYETLIGVIRAGLIKDEYILAFTYKIEEALSWFILPNQYIANFGDSDWRLMRIKSSAADKKWQTPEMKFVTTNGEIGFLKKQTMKAFEEAGYFIVRSNNLDSNVSYDQYSYLAQTGAFHSRTHKHADDLSFIWYERGHNILIDAGRYGYIGKAEIGTELWQQGYWYTHPSRLYCESTRAHNTLEFDGVDYARKGVKPYGSAIRRHKKYDNGLVLLETECKHFKSIRRVRVITYMPSQWLIVFDWFKDNAGDLHDVRQWFNFDPSLNIVKTGNNSYHTNLDDKSTLHITSLLEDATGSEVKRGVEEPRLQGWFSPTEKKVLANDSINFNVSQTNTASFATLFSFTEDIKVNVERNMSSISGRMISFSWEDSNGVHKVKIDRSIEKNNIECLYKISKTHIS
ncbi:heparinase II/III family protein [Psychrobacter sp. NPDC078501]|uniref:heparinase II/III domain-containing protein n=1 Tax=Psychrobacter sp. NPDC078501 TaxID=3364495 RepID=UPI00385019D2